MAKTFLDKINKIKKAAQKSLKNEHKTDLRESIENDVKTLNYIINELSKNISEFNASVRQDIIGMAISEPLNVDYKKLLKSELKKYIKDSVSNMRDVELESLQKKFINIPNIEFPDEKTPENFGQHYWRDSEDLTSIDPDKKDRYFDELEKEILREYPKFNDNPDSVPQNKIFKIAKFVEDKLLILEEAADVNLQKVSYRMQADQTAGTGSPQTASTTTSPIIENKNVGTEISNPNSKPAIDSPGISRNK